MAPKASILLIDDDDTLTRALDIYLTQLGYKVNRARDGLEGLRFLFDLRPDLVVLDVMMPHLDGWETCERIRSMSSVPIIMLTAKAQESERIRGLELGADDYVPKPFSLRELEARIQAILRRTRSEPPKAVKPSVLYATDDLIIDADRWEVSRNGQRIELTSTEARLLFYLAENAGRVLSHEQLLEEVWGPEYVGNSDYTKLFIWRLRQKIEPDPDKPRYILTERGVGYRLAPK